MPASKSAEGTGREGLEHLAALPPGGRRCPAKVALLFIVLGHVSERVEQLSKLRWGAERVECRPFTECLQAGSADVQPRPGEARA